MSLAVPQSHQCKSEGWTSFLNMFFKISMCKLNTTNGPYSTKAFQIVHQFSLFSFNTAICVGSSFSEHVGECTRTSMEMIVIPCYPLRLCRTVWIPKQQRIETLTLSLSAGFPSFALLCVVCGTCWPGEELAEMPCHHDPKKTNDI